MKIIKAAFTISKSNSFSFCQELNFQIPNEALTSPFVGQKHQRVLQQLPPCPRFCPQAQLNGRGLKRWMQSSDLHSALPWEHKSNGYESHSRGIQLAEHAQATLTAGKLHPGVLVTPCYHIRAGIRSPRAGPCKIPSKPAKFLFCQHSGKWVLNSGEYLIANVAGRGLKQWGRLESVMTASAWVGRILILIPSLTSKVFFSFF